jgi:hypothetical protein
MPNSQCRSPLTENFVKKTQEFSVLRTGVKIKKKITETKHESHPGETPRQSNWFGN